LWDAAVAPEDVSIKKGVVVFVVPEGTKWEKPKVLRKFWVRGATADVVFSFNVAIRY